MTRRLLYGGLALAAAAALAIFWPRGGGRDVAPTAGVTPAPERPRPLRVEKTEGRAVPYLSLPEESRPKLLPPGGPRPAMGDTGVAPSDPAAPIPYEEAISRYITPVIRARENVIRQLDGGYGYSSSSYGALFVPGAVEFATFARMEDYNRPTVLFTLDQVAVGDRRLDVAGAAAPAVEAEQRAVAYARGPVRERYVVRPDGLEQTFEIAELPAGRGAIRVSGTVSTNLTPPSDGSRGPRLAFTYRGEEALTISEPVAIDAAGRRLPLELAWEAGRMSMTVPAEWVEAATLPITIDPLIGGPQHVKGAVTWTAPNEALPRVTFNPDKGEWFGVWHEYNSSFPEPEVIMGITMASNGTLLSTWGITGGTTCINPDISYGPGSNRYLIVYSQRTANADIRKIGGKLIYSDILGNSGELTIADSTGWDDNPRLAWDGTKWYVVFDSILLSTGNYNIAGQFFNTNGAPGVRADPDAESDYAQYSAVAFVDGTYMITWKKGVSNTGLSGRTMNTSGTFLTPITQIEAQIGVGGHAVSGRPGQFLVTWLAAGTPNQLKGRVYTTSFVSSAGPFKIADITPNYGICGSVYSAPENTWYVVYGDDGTSEVFGRRVSPTGVVGPPEQISSTGTVEKNPGIALYPAGNVALVLYWEDNYWITGQRVSLSQPPTAPTGLTAVGQNAQVSLSWSAVAGATSYNVKRGTASGGPFTTIATVTAPTTTYLNTGLTNGTTYWYVVTAVNGAGEGPNSNVASAKPNPPPGAPTGLVATPGAGSISLSWTGNALATSYSIKRSTVTGGPYTVVATVNAPTTTYTNSGLTNGTTYFYVVTAVNGAGESANSNQASATPVATPPAPTGLTATPGDGQVALSWSAVAGATSYKVKRSTTSGGPYTVIATVTAPTTTFTNTGLTNGTTYYFVVSALNTTVEGPNSAQVSGRPQPAPVLLVVGVTPIVAGSGDAWIQSRLGTLGFPVTVKKADSLLVSGDATGKSLVLISATVDPLQVAGKFTTSAVPVLCGEGQLFDDLKMTASVAGTDFGTTATPQTQLTIAFANHPLAAGLTGTQTVSTAQTFTWGKPAAAGLTIATNGGKAVIFAYTAGSLMVGANAPARRVGFFLHDATAAGLNTQGGQLFDAAINWSVGRLAAPRITSITRKTWNRSPRTRGTGEPGMQVEVFAGSTSLGVVTVAADGTWNHQNTAIQLNAQNYSFTAKLKHPTTGKVSAASAAIQVTVDLTRPAAPGDVRLTAWNSAIDVEWDPPLDLDVAGYNVYLSTTGAAGSFVVQNKDASGNVKLVTNTKYRLTGLSATTTYYVQVTAVDDSLPE